MKDPTKKPFISFVIPVFNEEKNIAELYHEIVKTGEGVSKPFEIILIDDGSRDGSLKELKKIHEKDNRVIIVAFKRNFGQTAAMSAGFDYAQGKIIITMDGDLQNDPADVPRLLQKMDKGYDIVSGWRKNRKEAWLSRRLPSQTANWLIGKMTGVRLHDYGCSLKAYRKEVIEDLRLYGEMHRFIPALCSWRGAKITEIPVNDRARKHGESKYGISRTGRVILDLMTVKFLLGFSTKPMQVFGKFGFWFLFIGFLSFIAVIVMRLTIGFNMTGNPLLLIGTLLVLIGIQFFVMGLLAEINIRTYHESQNRPIYKVRKVYK